MKKYTLTIVLWIMGLLLMAQPVLEKTYSESATICQLANAGEVYYSMDVINKQCLIYKMDHTLWKSIPLSTPEGYYLEEIQHVSETLFNEDPQLELVYIYSKYIPTETSYYFTFESKLINENGTTLLTFPGAGYTQVIETAEHGKKFMVYEYDYSVIPYRTYTHVYSLPEEPVKSAAYAMAPAETGLPYPNPSSQQVTIPVRFPEGVSGGMLVLCDMSGRTTLEYPLRSNEEHVIIPTRQLVPGPYMYYVKSGGIQSSARKIMIR